MNNAFLPTHTVPPAGMASWPRPDPQAAQGPHIGGGLSVQVVERYNDWAKVAFDNGWIAWVDGRLLVPRTAGPPSAAAPPSIGKVGSLDMAALTANAVKKLQLAGAGIVAVSSFLPWFRGQQGVKSANPFDISLKFLFDYKTQDRSPKLGLLLIAVAAAIVIAIAKSVDAKVLRGVALAASAVGVLYVVQLQRLVSQGQGVSLTDFVGFGVFAAIAGGLVAAFAPQIAARRRQ